MTSLQNVKEESGIDSEYEALVKAGGGFSTSSLVEHPVTADRYVAFLDIMGFKERVARNSHEVILKELEQMSAFISTKLNGEQDISVIIFSDSFLFYTDSVYSDVLERLAGVLAEVMKYAISSQIPLKGVLAKGLFTVDTEKQLFFGQPLIDAYGLEEDIVIYGIVAHHTLEKDVKRQATLFTDVDITLKGGNSKHYLLRWWEDLQQAEDLLNSIRETVSDSPRRYIDKTIIAIDSSIESSTK